MKRQCAFSLLELLIVLAILSLLGGIVYAATGGVREKGRQSVCISNLHQLNAAFHMYLADYGAEEAPSLIDKIPITTALQAYGADLHKLHCPDKIPVFAVNDTTDYGFNVVSDPATIAIPPYVPRFPEVFRQCGDRTVIFTDSNHNVIDPDLPPENSAYWILSRYDSSVSSGRFAARVSANTDDVCFDH